MKPLDEKTKRKQRSFLALGTTLKSAETWATSLTILCSTSKLSADAVSNDGGSATDDDARGHDRSNKDQGWLVYR